VSGDRRQFVVTCVLVVDHRAWIVENDCTVWATDRDRISVEYPAAANPCRVEVVDDEHAEVT